MRNSIVNILLVIVPLLGWNSLMAQTDTDITSFRWYDLEEAQERAESEQKNVFIFTEAEWCAYCRQMKAEVFPKSEVQKTLQKHFYPVKIDIESDNVVTFNGEKMTEREFSHSMRISATPTMIFLDSSGDIWECNPASFLKRCLPRCSTTSAITTLMKRSLRST